MQKTSDINVVATRPLPKPAALLAELPKSDAQAAFITRAREEIHRLIFTDDKRFLLIVGPCSIHDLDAGREYARRLAPLAREVSDRVLVVMRVYFEKPRTTVGWKGLVMDPHLDGSNDIAAGLRLGRSFLRDVLDLGLPTATEFLDPITPQYVADLVCWGAIGARTTESQTHRQMASGLSLPLGFKNGTDGSLTTAINAIKAAGATSDIPRHQRRGRSRGGGDARQPQLPHRAPRWRQRTQLLRRRTLPRPRNCSQRPGCQRQFLVDCSHDNSAKKPELQPAVMNELIGQIAGGQHARSWARWSRATSAPATRPSPLPKDELRYGVSITDGCIDWATTEKLVRELHAALGFPFCQG
jgi:3-deoxy-7-phosphoheptulonate synthase